MKKLAALIAGVTLLFNVNGQSISDSVSMEALYTNQVFYSLENGEVSSIDNSDWELGFSAYGQGAAGSAIILNEATATLWAYPGDTSEWNSFDTTNYSAWERLLNSDTSWTNGALNRYRGAGGTFDLGWGVLNPTNNYWTFGDSLYLLQLSDDSFRKLWIKSLKTGVWEFSHANIDGSNTQSVTINKADFSNRNFAYYSVLNEQTLNREPNNTDWDILFTKHVDEVIPGMFVSVTSVFNNRTVWSAKSNEEDFAAANSATSPQTDLTQHISNIGREWKKYSSSNGWTVYDSIAYFLYDVDSVNFYRMVFTGFDGMSTGKAYFNKEKLHTVSLATIIGDVQYSLFPNPSNGMAKLLINSPYSERAALNVYSGNGTLIHSQEIDIQSGTSITPLNLTGHRSGLYFVNISSEHIQITQQLMLH